MHQVQPLLLAERARHVLGLTSLHRRRRAAALAVGILHEESSAHRSAVAAASAVVAQTGDWIEMKMKNGSYRLVRIERIHSSGTLDVVWFNRVTRETPRLEGVAAADCRARGSSPFLLPAKKLDIARRVGIVKFKDPKNGVGGIDEVGILYEAWNKARGRRRAHEKASLAI